MTYQDLAKRYNLDPNFVWNLIQVESRWKPDAKNPGGSARGLIQFIDSTAKSLGYLNSLDLVTKHPTVESQLSGPVKKYWDKWAPFKDELDLAACNFYPAYRKTPDAILPEAVRKANPGLNTIRDYYNAINKRGGKNVASAITSGSSGVILLIVGVAAFALLRK